MKILIVLLLCLSSSSCSIISGSFDNYSGFVLDRFNMNHSGAINRIESQGYERNRVIYSRSIRYKCKNQ